MIVLFGAGTTGRVIARDLNAKGTPALCFADNNDVKWGQLMEGIPVMSPTHAQMEFPDATWIASVVRPERVEIMAQIAEMGVKTVPMWELLPKRYNLPPAQARETVEDLLTDQASWNFWLDQLAFRSHPESYKQIPQSNIDDIYFETFISKREDERYVDCGAADGDTIKDFIKRWSKWNSIIAFEPDPDNFNKMCRVGDPEGKGRITHCGFAISDHDGYMNFTATGDYSSHLGGEHTGSKVRVCNLDHVLGDIVPTFIKMDIEGSELEALWGARRILKDHKPVLAICAYHEAEHIWEIPMLIHALQPEYKLFLRRYADSTFETVWYAVPPERVR